MSDDRTTGTLQALLESGWAYHDSASERLARELETAAQTGGEDGLLAPSLHLSTHTIGEHLGDWPRAMRPGLTSRANLSADAAAAVSSAPPSQAQFAAQRARIFAA